MGEIKQVRLGPGKSDKPQITIGSYFFYFNRAFVIKHQLKQYSHVKFGVDYGKNRYYFKFLSKSEPGCSKLIHNSRHNSYVMTIPAEIRKMHSETLRQPFPRVPRKWDWGKDWDFWIKGTIPKEKGGD